MMNRSQRRQARKVILAAALPIAIAITVIALGTSGGKPAGRPHSSTITSRRPLASGPMRLVAGAKQVNGVRTGYPHTLQGAVSAADEYLTDIGSTLDPDTAAMIARLTADPSYADAPQQAAAGTREARTSLGLPAVGAVPQGASLELLPVEYQVLQVTADQVTVAFLADYSGTTAAEGTVTHIAVFPIRMHWTGGDWKLLPFASGDYSSLTAQPGSPEAARKGWNYLEPAGR